MKKQLTATLLSSLILCAAACAQLPQGVSANANSASPYWNGADGAGVYSADSNCPLQVKSENLTFNITDFPKNGAESYSSTVRAEYEFYNPTTSDITARMLFPFGAEPDYYSEIEENSDLNGLYGVTTDGKDAGANLRYSFTENKYYFDFADDSAHLHDTKQEFGNFNEDTPVYKITLSEAETDYVAAFYTITSGETIMISDSYIDYYRQGVDDDSISVMLAFYKDEHTFYVIGELPEITACELTMIETSGSGGSLHVTNEYGAEVEFFTESAGTLGEFLELYNPLPEGDYSEIDWFNFTMYFLTTGTGYYFTDYCPYLWYETYLYKYMTRWYSYDLTVKAGETLINAVTAPTYPTVNTAEYPYTYEYNYLLSPASTWDRFENLTITINAPYYMLNCSFGFTMTGSVEDGTSVYTAYFDSLPDGELYFTLSEADGSESDDGGFNVLIIVIPAAIIAAGAAVGIAFLARRIKKKNGK